MPPDPKNLNIGVLNKSTLPLGVDLTAMIQACQKQVDRDFAPIWGITTTLFIVNGVTDDYPVLLLIDDADTANALGYHETTPNGYPIGKVFVRTTQQSGEIVSVTFSHELLELLADPDIQQVARNPQNGYVYALEVCDAVQSTNYDIDGVKVSNFQYPGYFSTSTPAGTQIDYLRRLRAPFTIDQGGYMPVKLPGRGWTQIFGSKKDAEEYVPEAHNRAPIRVTRGREIDFTEETFAMASKELIAAQLPQLQQQAMAMKLPWDKISRAVQEFGPEVLDLSKSLLANGFSIDWVVEAVDKLQPDVVRFIKEWNTDGQKMAAAAIHAGIPAEIGGAMLPFILRRYGIKILKALVPDDFDPFIDQYGDRLIELLLNVIGDKMRSQYPTLSPEKQQASVDQATKVMGKPAEQPEPPTLARTAPAAQAPPTPPKATMAARPHPMIEAEVVPSAPAASNVATPARASQPPPAKQPPKGP
jgi:hypothetical protein